MPYYAVFIQATMKNISSLCLPEDLEWQLDVEEIGGGQDARKNITFADQECVDPTSRSNFQMTWDQGTRATIKVVQQEELPRRLRHYSSALGQFRGLEADDPARKCVAIFDCRGLKPVRAEAVGLAVAKDSDGFEYDVDLEEPAWRRGDASVQGLSFVLRPL
mmetsp:Transcript_17585/g.40878  ORF Transcript_17585/g.40878 Transcript_17585/m.40878 type:complete len:162 (+) Transcript_17585:80-565(+)|eukprot:CAMPEP_0178460896 /NCGR_PEP_ID=MMETSP0689_2-20121128/48986_1 /TAXON_ID=160604 /ORGANISM="Amphidinium massartii, Strain CS-259" /LENGTH=161 /DNA_ID=CAMNT_0020087627 /DNA_START=67 /DNA_END=552 /DNA_ORIENTATION=+